jgi:hypothetical protein
MTRFFGQHLSAFAAQFFHPCPDYRKIVSGSGWGHRSSVFSCPEVIYPTAAIGSIRPGSLFFTLPTRVLTGQQIMPSDG